MATSSPRPPQFEIHRLISAQAGPRRGEARVGPRDALRRRFPGGRPREVQGGARGLLAGGRGRRALRRALRERKGAHCADRGCRSRGGGRAGRGQPAAVRRLPRRLLRAPLLLHARLVVVVVARRAAEAAVAGATASLSSARLTLRFFNQSLRCETVVYRGTYSLSIIQGSGRGAGRTDDEQRSGGRRRLRRPRGVQVDHREKGTRSSWARGATLRFSSWSLTSTYSSNNRRRCSKRFRHHRHRCSCHLRS